MSNSSYRKRINSFSSSTNTLPFIFYSLYFANSGLKTRLNLLNTGRAWWTLLVLILLASIAKIVPVTIATKVCTRKPWSYCGSMGVLMNTRGIVQLVVLNIGVQLKVIAPMIFAMFVLMATILTFITSPILYLLYVRNMDPKTLEESKVAHDLHSVLEGQVNLDEKKEDMTTISLDQIGTMPPRQLSIVSISKHSGFSSPRIAPRNEIDQSGAPNNIPPRRYSRMTLF